MDTSTSEATAAVTDQPCPAAGDSGATLLDNLDDMSCYW